MSEISKETGQATQTTQVTETTSAVGGGTQVTETTAAGEGTSRVAVTTEEKTTTVPFSGSPTSASATSANAIQATQTEATTIYHARTSQATVNVPVSSTSTSTSTSASVTSKPPKKTGQTNQTTPTTQRLEATTGTIREPSQSQNLSTTATQVQSTGIRTDTLAVSSLFATTDRTKTPSTATSRRHKIPTSASVTSKRPNTSSTKYLSTSSQGSTKKHNNISTTASRPGQKEFTKDSSSRGFSLAVIISIVGVVLFLLILVVILLVIVKKRRSSSYSVSTAQTTQGSAAQFDNPAFGYHSMKEDEKLEEPDQEDKQMPADPYKITESDWTEAAVSGSTTSPKTDDKERLI
jgi:preprotein translocase subunit Sss1